MSGYSSTPLSQKLGIKANSQICLLNAPSDYLQLLIPTLPANVQVINQLESSSFIHYFTTDLVQLQQDFPQLMAKLEKQGSLWISWRKGNKDGIRESQVQTIGLDAGLVDVKVCAIDAEWSGLKFVWRTVDRN